MNACKTERQHNSRKTVGIIKILWDERIFLSLRPMNFWVMLVNRKKKPTVVG